MPLKEMWGGNACRALALEAFSPQPIRGRTNYAYTSPEPPGLPTAAIRPQEAFYSRELGEFLLLYEEVRNASSPEQALLAFFQSAYEVGASLGQWDREALERGMR